MDTTKRIISYIIYVALTLGSLVAIYFSLQQMGVESWLWTALFLAIGFFLSNFIYIFIHELGHLIGGFIAGFKFYSFSVLFLKFIKINGKLKLRFSLSREIAGYCQMIPPHTSNLENAFKKYVAGSLVSSTLFLAVALFGTVSPLIFPTFFAGKSLIYSTFALAFVGTFPTHVANFSELTPNPTTDGAILRGLKSNSPTAQTQIKMISIQSLLFSGTRPADLDKNLIENLSFDDETYIYAPLFESYKLSHYLDLKDYKNVITSSDFIKTHFRDTNEVFHQLLLCDVFYVELVLKKDIDEAERIYFYIAKFLKSHLDISTLRIRMAKEIFIDSTFSQALNTGVKAKNLAESYEAKGGADMECEIIDELSKIAREQKEIQLRNSTIDFRAVE
ncbi:MAG: hypothetical protein R3Y32_04460 [Bacillota bacterium]